MGPGPNNCPGILRGKDTIEGEDEEDEEGEKGREEERKEGGSDSVEIRGDWQEKTQRFFALNTSISEPTFFSR